MKSLDAVVISVAGFVVALVVIAAILLLLLLFSFCVNHFYDDLIKYIRQLLQIVLTLPSILFLSYW